MSNISSKYLSFWLNCWIIKFILNLSLACKCLIFQPIYLGLSKQANSLKKHNWAWLSMATIQSYIDKHSYVGEDASSGSHCFSSWLFTALHANGKTMAQTSYLLWLYTVFFVYPAVHSFCQTLFFLLYRPYSALTLVALQNLTSVTLLSL